jgi:hypothetical protein
MVRLTPSGAVSGAAYAAWAASYSAMNSGDHGRPGKATGLLPARL